MAWSAAVWCDLSAPDSPDCSEPLQVDLSENKVSTIAPLGAATLPALSKLLLCNNPIKTVEDLKPLVCVPNIPVLMSAIRFLLGALSHCCLWTMQPCPLPSKTVCHFICGYLHAHFPFQASLPLTVLDLFGCPVTSSPNYRKQVRPTLHFPVPHTHLLRCTPLLLGWRTLGSIATGFPGRQRLSGSVSPPWACAT
jgi:hypothetical protein